MGNINSFSSRHFRLERLSDGVYAAIHNLHTEDGWAGCNAGIVDLGDRTLVFDTFESPQAARDLRDAAKSLTGRKVHTVINSHPHNDHYWGNQVFGSDVDIISTTKTRELIAAEGPGEVQWYRDTLQKRLEILEAQLAEAHDEATQVQLRFLIFYYQSIIAILPELQIRLPNLTFTGDLTFNGPKRSTKLITFEGGHSKSDAILHLPDDSIVFMADLLFIDVHPYFPDGDPAMIQDALAQVRNLNANTFVPGHGPVGQFISLDWMDEYINTMNSLVREAIKKGSTEKEIGEIAMPVEFQHLIMPSFFPANLKFLYQKQISTGSGLVP
jgi:glyoxylase-like metal-dependent hydrolase (beta-lactamase superfamily II)